MSSIALRGLVRRWRGHAASAVLIVVLAGAIAAHHAAPALGDAHHAPGLGAVAELCLGVFMAAGGVAVAATALVTVARRDPSRSGARAQALWPSCLPEARARAGPAALALLCVSRR